MYFVTRAMANQFMPYSGDAAFSGAVCLLFAASVGALALLKPSTGAPRSLLLLGVLGAGLYVSGLLRSPNLGVGVPLACDGAMYLLLLLCGYAIAQQDDAEWSDSLLHLFSRALVAMIVVEALAAIWQRYVDLPWLHQQVAAGREMLPTQLQSTAGLLRFQGTDVFGTFGNPNSLAAYLVIGVWLLAGLTWDGSLRRRITGAVLLVPLVWALLLTHSKGGLVACAVGAWFFFSQRVSGRWPAFKRPLITLTIIGFVLASVVLALACTGELELGASMQVRLDYWRVAWRMIAQRPLDGVGLGGFAEWYPFFKTLTGTETREAHNDYVHLFAELGVLAPVVYLTLWGVLLKAGGRSSAVEKIGATETTDHRERLVILGGVAGFVMLDIAFQPLNAAEVWRLFGGQVNAHTLFAVLQTVALPVLFGCVVVGLRKPNPPTPFPRREGGDGEAIAWRHGFCAAAGALLVHQLVDFDFRAQAVMGGMLLLAGMICGRPPHPQSLSLAGEGGAGAAPQPALQTKPREGRGNWAWAIVALALLLLPGAVYVPIVSGMARMAAEWREQELRETPRPEDPPLDRKVAREDIVALRQSAVDAAPFDSAAWIDLAGAYESLQAAIGSRKYQGEILRCLQEAERLRPLAAYPKSLLGDYYLRAGMRARGNRDEATVAWEKAAEFHQKAAERYPLAPGYALAAGDSLLLLGRTGDAAAWYWRAFEADIGIGDVNVRLSAAFTDPQSGALPRHGLDGEIILELDRALSKQSSGAASAIVRGIGLRRMIAFAAMIHEARRAGGMSGLLSKFGGELIESGPYLLANVTTIPDLAHAAFLIAMSYELAPGNPNKARAWTLAREYQQWSLLKNTPGTQPYIFDYCLAKFGSTR
jgi:O-antigen ligase/tetratricopeptide (TPR) repeat protein